MEDIKTIINSSFPEVNEDPKNLDVPAEDAVQKEEIIHDSLQTQAEDTSLENTQEKDATQEPLQDDKESQLSGIVERLVAVEEELKRSNQLFENKFLYDTAKEEVITKLHKELQGYKDDLFKKMLKPLIMDMIGFADNMRGLVSHYEESPEADVIQERYQKLRNEFLKIGNHIEDVIYNYGVEPFSSKQGDEFNPKTQQARKNTVSENQDEHKKIISSLSPGYLWDEQLLRRESVHVSICE